MTAIVGILCQQGIVIGSDSSATFGAGKLPTIEQPMEKLNIIGESVIIAGTGQVGLGQRFEQIVEKAWSDRLFTRSQFEVAKYLSKTTIEDFAATHVNKEQYGALVAFPSHRNLYLCEFAVSDFQPEFKTNQMWYCSMGVTQTITDSFLALMRDLFWKSSPPSLNDGMFAVTWALDHAIAVNPGGVNKPIRLAVLGYQNGQVKAEIVTDAILDEHRQNVEGAKDAIRDYCKDLHRIDATTPDVPHPT